MRVNRSVKDNARERGVTIKGAPSIRMPVRTWPRLVRPMRPMRSVRTLMKVDPKLGVTQPEFKNTLMRAGVGVRQRAIAVIHQHPLVPPRPRSNVRVIAPPSPTNRGGVRNPITNRRNPKGRR